MTPTQKKRRPFRRPEFLLALYTWMASYQKGIGLPPSRRDIVAGGFAASNSSVTYFLDRMVELRMIEHIPHLSRGIKLLPLKGADPIIRNLLKKENTDVPAN